MEVLVTIHSSDVPVVAMGTMVVDWVNFFAQIVDAELPRGSERKVLLDTCLALTEYIASREEGFVFAPAVCAAGAVVAASYFLLTECREKVLNTLAREAGSAPSEICRVARHALRGILRPEYVERLCVPRFGSSSKSIVWTS
mmetsp:Transcript_20831/g.46495  ORF Transcript_20831/g.46495 Transcript_20831/m.46495 type:complete len:142 (+) Transcript_20831:898-1323(+)